MYANVGTKLNKIFTFCDVLYPEANIRARKGMSKKC
jgi:hypothetical protein